MADPKKRLATNLAGPVFVDATCIDCATCRWMAPETFDQADGQSRVHAQPGDAEARRRALLALIACPTGSIGAGSPVGEKAAIAAARDAFPVPIDDRGVVHHCGYHAESSFGAASWFVKREAGNLLVDSPRFTAALASRLEDAGGVATLLLTHKDDVADYRRFRERFGCEVVIHRGDRGRLAEIDRVLDGEAPIELAPDLLAVPTPGHTRGSVCFLLDQTYLFGGDHVAWSDALGHIYAFRGACWFDWATLGRSMRRLAAHRFEWILPGHGWPCRFEPDRMAEEMRRCLEWIETV